MKNVARHTPGPRSEFRNFPKWILVVVLALSIASSPAADGPAPEQEALALLSAGPLLNRAPDFSRWVITTDVPITEGHAPKNQDAGAQYKTIVTKTLPVFHVELFDRQGRKTEKWCRGGLEATVRADWDEPIISSGENEDDLAYGNYMQTDFQSLGWLSAENFVGIRDVGGSVCMVFRDAISIPAGRDGPLHSPAIASDTAGNVPGSPLITAEAYIDSKTRLPVRLILAGQVSTFHFEKPPDTMQMIPQNVAEAMSQHEQNTDKLLRPAASP